MKRLTIVLTVIAAAACGKEPEALKQLIPVGAGLDRSGSLAAPTWHDATRLAFRHASEGFAKTTRWENVAFDPYLSDTQNLPDVSVRIARELVEQQGIRAFMIDSSTDATAVNSLNYDADPANDLNIPIACGSCTSGSINNPNATSADAVTQASLRDANRWMFKATMSTANQALILMNIAMATNNGDTNNDGNFKIAIYASGESFGRSTTAALISEAKKRRPDVLVEALESPFPVSIDKHDWATDAAKLPDAFNENTQTIDGLPDIIFESCTPVEGAAISKAYVQSGYGIRMLHTQAFRFSSSLNALGGAANGQEGTSTVLIEEGPQATIFREEMKAATGLEIVFRDTVYYDAAYAIALGTLVALHDNDLADPTTVTGPMIRDGMLKISDPAGVAVVNGADGFAAAAAALEEGKGINYQGLSGPLDFDANRSVLQKLALWRIENNDFRDLKFFDCISDASCPEIQ